MAAYAGFAGLYDRLMDDFDYAEWAEYYLTLLDRAGVRPAALCDCGCGTGSMTVEFAARGIRATGADISPEMLEQAAEKARRRGVPVSWTCQDMTDLRLPKPVDALVCACDGVNYLTSLARVESFFRAAFRALRPGGALAFDISSRYKLEEEMGDAFFGEERDDVAYLWENRLDAQRHIVTMDITFFAREESGLYRRIVERHTQRAHSAQEIAAALAASGFEKTEVFGDRKLAAPGPEELRLHFLARRP